MSTLKDLLSLIKYTKSMLANIIYLMIIFIQKYLLKHTFRNMYYNKPISIHIWYIYAHLIFDTFLLTKTATKYFENVISQEVIKLKKTILVE